jgi:hypothetical protein
MKLDRYKTHDIEINWTGCGDTDNEKRDSESIKLQCITVKM